MDNLEQHLLDIEEKLGYTGGTPEDIYDPLAWHLDKIEELIDEGGSSSGEKHFYDVHIRFSNQVEEPAEEGTPLYRDFYARFYDTREILFNALSNFAGGTAIESPSDLEAWLQTLPLQNQLSMASLMVTLNTYSAIVSFIDFMDNGFAEPMVCSVLLNGYLGVGSVCTGTNNGALTAVPLEEVCNVIGNFTNPSLTVSISEDGVAMN